MHHRFSLAVTLTLFCFWAESLPVNLGTLEFDNLDTDLSELTYEVEEEDLDDLTKLLNEADATTKNTGKSKTSAKTSGVKKKNTANQGVKGTHNIKDLKQFFKAAGLHDQGAFDDDEIYALAEGLAGQAVSVKGNEDREYKKGTKTRGFHRVQHKDEYKKDKVFFEDDVTSGSQKKTGAKGVGVKVGAGVGYNKGHFHHDRQKGLFGKQGYSDEGIFDKQFKAFADSQGLDESFSRDS